MRRGDQRVDGENAKRGRRINYDELEILEDGRKRVLQLEGRVELPRELLLKPTSRRP